MSFSTDYNKSRLANPNIKSVADYRASLNAPTQNQISQGGASLQSPNANVNPTLRDYEKEKAVIEKLNLNPLQMSMIEPKTIYERAYTPSELANLADYQQIIARNQAQADLGATQRPTNSVMGILENALRTKSDVAKQSLGTSDLYAQAGLPTQGVSGYTTLLDSLNQRKNEMNDKYLSFKDQVTSMAGSMANVYNLALDKYTVLNEDYQKQVDRMTQITQSIIDHEEQLNLINEQAKLNERYLKLQTNLANTDTTTTITPSGTISTIYVNDLKNKPIILDDVAIASIYKINEQAKGAGITEGFMTGAPDVSSYRSKEQQQQLYDRFLNGGPLAAPPGSSKHESGLAIDLYPDQEYISKMKPIMEANGWVQNAGDSDKGHFEYVGTGTKGTLDTTDIMAIGKLVYGVRISDKETQIVQKAASENPGLDRFGLIQKVLGFNVEKNIDLGIKIMEVLQQTGGENGLMQYDWLSIANLLNNDKKKEAISLMERYVYDKAMKENETNYISESTAVEATSKANAIQDMVAQLNATGKNPIGNFEGTFEQWLGRFKSGDAQKIATKTMQMVKEFSNKFLGSAMTKTELDFYRDIVPSLIDSTGNFTIKLNSLKQDPLAKINSIRQSYNLPLIDESQLMDKGLRVPLYGGNGNVIQVIGTDGLTYPYNLDDPAQKAEYEAGVKAKFFIN